MAAYKILGNVQHIGATEQIPTKNGSTFTKRTLVLIQRRFDQNTGEEYEPNYPVFEFTGNSCSQLDNFSWGDRVQVSFEVSGSKYNDKQTNEEKYIVRLRGFKCEAYQMPQQTNNYQAPAPQPQPQPQQAYAPQQGYAPTPQQQGYAPQPNYQQMPPQPQNQPQAQGFQPPQVDANGNPVGKDGLPF